jgi:hypothetical protein
MNRHRARLNAQQQQQPRRRRHHGAQMWRCNCVVNLNKPSADAIRKSAADSEGSISHAHAVRWRVRHGGISRIHAPSPWRRTSRLQAAMRLNTGRLTLTLLCTLGPLTIWPRHSARCHVTQIVRSATYFLGHELYVVHIVWRIKTRAKDVRAYRRMVCTFCRCAMRRQDGNDITGSSFMQNVICGELVRKLPCSQNRRQPTFINCTQRNLIILTYLSNRIERIQTRVPSAVAELNIRLTSAITSTRTELTSKG